MHLIDVDKIALKSTEVTKVALKASQHRATVHTEQIVPRHAPTRLLIATDTYRIYGRINNIGCQSTTK